MRRIVASAAPPLSPANYVRCQPPRISIKISRRALARLLLTSSLNYTSPNDSLRPTTMLSCPIHFRNEINKIVILNLENINVPPEVPSTRPVYMAFAGAQNTRKSASPARVQLGGARS